MCKEVSHILDDIKNEIAVRAPYVELNLENNSLLVSYKGAIVSTIFIEKEIHNECAVPLDKGLSFSNSMSYSLDDCKLCIDDCVKAISSLEKKCAILEELSDDDSIIELNSNNYKMELSDSVILSFGLSPIGFYCKVHCKGNNLQLSRPQLEFIKYLDRILEINATLKFYNEEEVKVSKAFIDSSNE